jgi:protein ImuB
VGLGEVGEGLREGDERGAHLPNSITPHQDRTGSASRSWSRYPLPPGRGGASSGTGESAVSPPPLVIVAKIKSALRIVALDEQAAALGLSRGQPLADARAMIPSLEALDENATADAELLESVAGWAERYTPLVAIDEPHGLMLDITGAAHLFGGEALLLADLAFRITAQGFALGAAIADTPGAASAAARFTSGGVVPEGGAASLLVSLPLAALRLDVETVSALDRVGLKRIGQILDAPRAPLAARFGRLLIRRLDQALGREEEAIGPRRPVAPLIAERRFAEPIVSQDDIAATIVSLAGALATKLVERGMGARAYELLLFRVDGAVSRIAVSTSRPLRAPKLVLDLFREKFAGLAEEIDAGFGFDMIRLSVPVAAADDPAQVDLSGDASAEADLDRLIDRIGARIGPERVGRIVADDSHIPERASKIIENGGQTTEDGQRLFQPPSSVLCPPSSDIPRPLRLFARPEPVEAIAAVPDGPPVNFRWRRALYRVARVEGPERIAGEWWRDDSLTRDYFRVEDSSGHRFWLFREGLYGRETSAPRWYLHGVFA